MTVDIRASDEAAGGPVSLGSGSIVPDLIGLSLEDACEAAAWAGLKLNATSTARRGRVGIVVAQSPPPGSSTGRPAQIHVSVSTPGQAWDSAEA